MKTVVEYKLVRAGSNNLMYLEEQIQMLIKQGWQPHGDLKEASSDIHRVFVQAMVKYAD